MALDAGCGLIRAERLRRAREPIAGPEREIRPAVGEARIFDLGFEEREVGGEASPSIYRALALRGTELEHEHGAIRPSACAHEMLVRRRIHERVREARVIGAGRLRAAFAVVSHTEAGADKRPRAIVVGAHEIHTVLVAWPVARRLRTGVQRRHARG